MSADEQVLARIASVANRVNLEFILVGNSAAALHDVPVMTNDFDLFVRHTPINLRKIQKFAELVGGSVMQPYEPLSRMLRVVGPRVEVPVDFVFELSSRKKFESVRSRGVRVKVGAQTVLIASLVDVIAAKEAAGRPKDKAVLPILQASLRAKREMEKDAK